MFPIILIALRATLILSSSVMEADEQWATYKLRYGKVYSSHDEEMKRYGIWRNTNIDIAKHNAAYDQRFVFHLFHFFQVSESYND